LKYLLRFDDITPGMSWSKFLRLKEFIEGYDVKSILGVVPNSLDPKLDVEQKKDDFFDLVRKWKCYGDAIVQHGTNHIYTTKNSGMLGINKRSEFSGLDYDDQLKKIETGKLILQHENVWQPWFMAPAHSFDENTVKALVALDFLAITDGYGFYPYMHDSLLLVPQLTSFPIKCGFGISTICLHINSMNDYEIERIKKFVSINHGKILDFREVVNSGPVSSRYSSITRNISIFVLKRHREFRNAFRGR
jgi:predicted deacetylase